MPFGKSKKKKKEAAAPEAAAVSETTKKSEEQFVRLFHPFVSAVRVTEHLVSVLSNESVANAFEYANVHNSYDVVHRRPTSGPR